MPHPRLLHSEPLSLQPTTADPYLHRRCSDTDLSPSLWGPWVLVHTRFFLCSPRVCFPVLCKFWWFYGGLMATPPKSSCHTQVYCTQSPSPHSSPLLTRTSSGDTQTQFCLSFCGVSGSWCTQGMFEPSEHLWQVWGLIPGWGRAPGEGNGNPLQYSCLGNPVERGTWWATAHGVLKNRTCLSN